LPTKWTFPHLVDIEISGRYTRRRRKDGNERQRTAGIPEGLQKFIRRINWDQGLRVCGNILNREFQAGRSGEKRVSGITYLRTVGGRVYLRVVGGTWLL
jgi:hypothetical protein